MSTTYIKLFAGLGNQLFQYSYGKYLEQQGKLIKFILNRTYDKDGNCFDLPECFCVNESQILMPKSKLVLNYHKAIAKYVAHDWNNNFYQEYRFPQNLPDSTFIFKKKELYEKTDIAQQISSCESVSLHIRGGDYLSGGANKEYGNICTIDYYHKALELVYSKLTNAVIFIFTNDKAYANAILNNQLNKTIRYIPETSFSCNPGFDLFLMSQCKHNIIANSTFSWWGAFLNKNLQKIVVAPEKWSNKLGFKSEELIPDTWKKI